MAFELLLRLHMRPQWIQYRARFWTQVKFAWVQYLSVFLVIFWILNRLRNELFQHQLLTADPMPCEALQVALLTCPGKHGFFQ